MLDLSRAQTNVTSNTPAVLQGLNMKRMESNLTQGSLAKLPTRLGTMKSILSPAESPDLKSPKKGKVFGALKLEVSNLDASIKSPTMLGALSQLGGQNSSG